ncbi:MAG: lactate utilization protein [Acutalibacteraceae bacterium]|nr:lactate utilization protein [Acutalibacteraceae bacterium]
MTEIIKNTIKALEKNNMLTFYAEKKEDIMPIIKTLIKKGDSVAFGGSVSLNEIGAVEEIRKGDYEVIDRYAPNLTAEQRKEAFRKAFFADVFLTSTNALTEKGELINVDGNGNRVAAMIYGPDSVIVVVGANKLVKNAEEGFERIKQIAAPKNCVRLSLDSYCHSTGKCMALNNDEHSLSDGCYTNGRICCSYTVQGFQRTKDRIKVILCGEALGY